jgi:hypothetical protein
MAISEGPRFEVSHNAPGAEGNHHEQNRGMQVNRGEAGSSQSDHHRGGRKRVTGNDAHGAKV